MDLHAILNLAVREKASDVHFKAGLPPVLRIHGSLLPIKNMERLIPDEVAKVGMRILNDAQKEVFKNNRQVDLAYSVPGLGRFRVNIFQQRGATGIVLRVIPMTIRSFEDLRLPEVIKKIAMEQRGLVLVTGITGSGKSTTLAAMVDYINANRTSHIITIEDPIEFLHRDKKSIINQREIGTDANSFSAALRGALRQDPDIIMVGEMRDLETIEIALTAAETGHLVLATLHTIDAAETINRVVSVFAPYQQKQIRIQVAGVIKGIISQRLMPMKDGKGRVPAIEVMVSTGRIRECIEDKEKTKEIHDAIGKGYTTYGMQTFDQSILSLLNKGYITYEEALMQASNPDDFALQVKGITSASDTNWGETGNGETKGGAGGSKFDMKRF
ncbi:MAG: type IV pili twitching motility protein PilT [Deltaproteobacteria bacterium GWC2_42_11]|nr:MAG: type IV pili twitching motility protein PilT [Deltaproteobacteria bacterium GWC2_42_11]HBO84506.1 type IV pili twitching motility protein PilT [Deltaproteobacteria bacterium]